MSSDKTLESSRHTWVRRHETYPCFGAPRHGHVLRPAGDEARGGTVMKAVQFLIAGIALGGVYGLVSLGFVIVYKSTGVISLAQGGLVLIGAYVLYGLHVSWFNFPFYLALVLAVAITGVLGAAIGAVIFSRMEQKSTFAIIMVTIGFLYVMQQGAAAIWGDELVFIDDPWGSRTLRVFGVSMLVADAWSILFSVALFLLFLVFFRYSLLGIAMRASSRDAEAAAAQGISRMRVAVLSWAIAGALGALAGVMLAAGPRGLSPDLSAVAFAALPAVVFGGLNSPAGAVLGGTTVGIVQVMSSGYARDLEPYFGDNFYTVAPYVVMIAVLLVLPYGLFGTRSAERG
jgi:branched-chain amino acid transport system permease protein